jgi:hypothetical protein
MRELQSSLAKAGIEGPARAVNYALHIAERRVAGPIEKAFGYAAYEIPSAYGYRPERTLLTVVFLIPLLSPLYRAAIIGATTRRDNAGIWLRRGERLEFPRPAKPVRLNARNSRPGPWPVALYVSVLSGFRIGWHDFNVGEWIARLQRTEYKLEGVGWPRTVMGLQSLVSIYMLVRFLLEYFGL